MTIPAPLQFAIVVAIWGSTFLAITTQLEPGAAIWSICYRFLIAGLLLSVLTRLRKETPPQGLRVHVSLALFGLFLFSINYIGTYTAEQTVPSGVVAVAFTLMAVLNPLLARLVLGQPFTRGLMIGGALAVAGVTLLFWREVGAFSLADGGLRGALFALLAVLFAAVGNLFPAMPRLRTLPPFALNATAMLYGSAMTGVIAFVLEGPPPLAHSMSYLLGLGYLAVFGSVIAFSLYAQLLRSMGVGRAAYVNVLAPVVALLLSTLFEGYRWDLAAGAGAILVFIGTAIAIRSRTATVTKG